MQGVEVRVQGEEGEEDGVVLGGDVGEVEAGEVEEGI